MAAIFDHHLNDMTAAVARALDSLSVRPTYEKIRSALESCWVDTCAITWTTADVLSEFPCLTVEQARKVLECMVHEYDATRGVTWDNMGTFVGRVAPYYDGEDEIPEMCRRLKAIKPDLDVAALGEGELRDLYVNAILGRHDDT